MNERQTLILEALRTSDQTIKSLAIRHQVAEMTVRRDLKALGEQADIVISNGVVRLYDRLHKSSEDVDSGQALVRNAIAAALYHRIFPAETLFVSGGRTTLAFARYLCSHCTSPVTVVTNSLASASTLFSENRTKGSSRMFKVILLGGEFRTDMMDLMGPVAEKNLREYHVSWLVTGCDAANPESGFYSSDLSVSNLERESVKIADHTAVVTESLKFGSKALVKFADFSDIDLLVTDDRLDPAVAESLKQHGLEVIQAGLPKD